MTIQGGCLCGAVRYVCDTGPTMQFNCHCRDCQRATGSGFAPIAFFPREQVKITGAFHSYTSLGSSGQPIKRGFCPGCGSNLFGDVAMLPHLLSIRAGTLDDPSQFTPKAHLFASQAAPWDHLDTRLMTFASTPPTYGTHHADNA